MGWLAAVGTGLVMAMLSVGVWIGPPVDRHFPHSQLRHELNEDDDNNDTSRCFPALFSFGSSVADTGTNAVAFALQPTQSPPFGSTFFGKPANRFSDGRLHIDFWATALRIPFLDPYVKAVGSNFRRGANFASSGARVTASTAVSPFPLSTQLNQLRQFKRDVVELIQQGSSSQNTNKLPVESFFGEALYVIAIGGNDILAWSLIEEKSFQEAEQLIPQISNEMLRVVEALYDEGARHILVEDVFPQGCSPFFLARLAESFPDDLDAAGCLQPINDLVQLHNSLLKKGIADLGKRLPDASISYVDTYRRRYSIIANHEQYGFTEPLKPCYRASRLQYNTRAGRHRGAELIDDGVLTTAGACDNASSHVHWDQLHYTDAFNRVTMQSILSGDYFEPSFELLRNSCALGKI